MQGHIKLLCVVPKFRNQSILTPCIEIFEFKVYTIYATFVWLLCKNIAQ